MKKRTVHFRRVHGAIYKLHVWVPGRPRGGNGIASRGRRECWLPRTVSLSPPSYLHPSIYPSIRLLFASSCPCGHRGGKKICLPRKPPSAKRAESVSKSRESRVGRPRLIGGRDCDAALRQRPIGSSHRYTKRSIKGGCISGFV